MLKRTYVGCKHYNYQTAECKKIFLNNLPFLQTQIIYSKAHEMRKEKCGLENPIYYESVKKELYLKKKIVYNLIEHSNQYLLYNAIIPTSLYGIYFFSKFYVIEGIISSSVIFTAAFIGLTRI